MAVLCTKTILACALLLCVPVWCSDVSQSTRFSWNRIKYVYSFGDSYSFVQGTAGHANFSFIGDTLKISFTPQQLLADKIVFRNTSSGGANWLEFLTRCFEGSPFACPKQLWDFAFAGADIDGNLLPLHHDFTVPLVDQVTQWVKYASQVIPHAPEQTLTTWWIGINDARDIKSTITNITTFLEWEMTSYFKAVDVASQKGLKNHLFLNVPPEERSPASLSNPGHLKENIDSFNAILSRHIDRFATTHKDNNVLVFDAHAWFNNILNNFEDFGFANVTGFCTCDQQRGYFWYDSGHPTERVHQLLAQTIEQFLQFKSKSL